MIHMNIGILTMLAPGVIFVSLKLGRQRNNMGFVFNCHLSSQDF